MSDPIEPAPSHTRPNQPGPNHPEPIRPAILLDVDGPLNPFADCDRPRAATYRSHLLRPKIFPDRPAENRTVWLDPGHGALLLDLAAATGADLVWATLWEDEANRLLAAPLGLPELDVIRFAGTAFQHSDGHHAKIRGIDSWAGGRPLVWFDDQFQPRDAGWARDRSARTAPTRLIPIDPTIGLTRADVDGARDFLLASRRTAALSGHGESADRGDFDECAVDEASARP
ncbi:HAD domain-containing protein [Nocardia sp. NPDC057668]|uniref:HAD domain-containing protein n=1 Tax=Nocardia sp. NPDC057668 TaxID=3346202 RepID=UPI00366CF439